MRRITKKASSKPTGPCTLCGVKTASSWRRIPSTVAEAAGQSSCNACYVFVLKRHKDDEESVPLALEVCRASKRSRAAMQQAEEGEEEQEEEMCIGGISPGAGSPGSSTDTPTLPAAAGVPVAHVDASCSTPVVHPGASSSKPALHAMRSGGQPPVRSLDSSFFAADATSPVQQGRRQPQERPVQPALTCLPPPGRAAQLATPRAALSEPPRSPPFTLPRSLPFASPPRQAAAGPQAAAAAASQQAALQQPAGEMSGELQALQQACWQVSHDSQAAELARGYAAQLPGLSPKRLGALPAVWLLLPATDRPPQPAGVLLLSVRLPPRSLAVDAQQVLLDTGTGLQAALRVLVYCRHTGQVLQWRDWLQRDEGMLYTHPRHQVPAWDSSEGWKLLFPETASDTAQARLFTGLVGTYGAAVAAPAPPTFLVGGGGTPQHHGEANSTSTAEPPSPQHQQSHQRWRTPTQLQQLSPPPAQQQQQQQHSVWHSEDHSSHSHRLPPGENLQHGRQWGQRAASAALTLPQLPVLLATSFRQMAASLEQPLQQPQQLPGYYLAQQPQQQPQQPQQQALLPGSLVGGHGIFHNSFLEPLLVCPDAERATTMPGDPRLAADLLSSTPVELLDEELLHWIVNIGSGAAPGGSLPFTP